METGNRDDVQTATGAPPPPPPPPVVLSDGPMAPPPSPMAWESPGGSVAEITIARIAPGRGVCRGLVIALGLLCVGFGAACGLGTIGVAAYQAPTTISSVAGL